MHLETTCFAKHFAVVAAFSCEASDSAICVKAYKHMTSEETHYELKQKEAMAEQRDEGAAVEQTKSQSMQQTCMHACPT